MTDGVLFFVFFAHVVEDVLHVFVFLDFFEKFVDALALLGCHVLEVVGDALEFRADDFKAVVLEVFLDVGILLERTVEHDLFVAVLVFVVSEFVDAVVDEFELEVIERNAVFGFDLED